MKHNKKTMTTPESPAPKRIPVRFEFTQPTAVVVCVAGAFNNRQPEAKVLHFSRGGRWLVRNNSAMGTELGVLEQTRVEICQIKCGTNFRYGTRVK